MYYISDIKFVSEPLPPADIIDIVATTTSLSFRIIPPSRGYYDSYQVLCHIYNKIEVILIIMYIKSVYYLRFITKDF